MQIKTGATLSGLKLVMREVLIVADEIWKKYGQELVVTSGTDGNHSAGSLHYYGYAVDLRIRYFGKGEKEQVAKELKQKLGSDFVVILDPDHIHVHYKEYDSYESSNAMDIKTIVKGVLNSLTIRVTG